MKVVEDAKQAVQGAASAVMAKAVQMAPDSWMPGGKPDPLIRAQHGHIGRPVSRVDGPVKVRGAAPYAAEFPLDGMLYASLVFSTVAKGTISALDTTAAEAAPGVALVMSYRNAPRMKPMPLFMTAEKACGGNDLPVMQDAKVYWNGEPVALVLAETQEQADHAAALIHVAYEEEHAVTALAEAKAKGVEPGQFMGQPLKFENGSAEEALAHAVHKVDQHYTTPRHSHNAIELHAVTVAWDGDHLRVHDASQMVAHTAWSLGHVFGIDEDQVHVTSPFVGGGFGGKGLWQHQVLAAAASKLAGRPVRLMLSREGVYRIVGGRTITEQRVALGADADGRFDALIHTGTTAMSHHNVLPEPFILPARSAYATKTMKLDVEVAYLDMVANTFMRAPGEAVGTFALESAIDELAHDIGLDPVELRLRNEPDKDPTTGAPFSSREVEKAFRDGAERFGWSKRQAPGTRREGEWLIGTGVATATYPYYRMPGGAARITLRADGAVIDIAAHDMGMGTATAQTQVAADRLAGDRCGPFAAHHVLVGALRDAWRVGELAILQARLVAERAHAAGHDGGQVGVQQTGPQQGPAAGRPHPAAQGGSSAQGADPSQAAPQQESTRSAAFPDLPDGRPQYGIRVEPEQDERSAPWTQTGGPTGQNSAAGQDYAAGQDSPSGQDTHGAPGPAAPEDRR